MSTRAPIRALRKWFAARDLRVLLAALLIVAGVWGFVELSGLVNQGETQRIEERILVAMRQPDDPGQPVGPRWLAEVGRDLTALGGVAVLTLVTAGVAGFLLLRRQFGALVLVLAATGGGLALSSILKRSYERPRPRVVPHLSYVSSSSFPSGHSMLSAVVYLTLGALLARLIHQRIAKIYVLSLAFVLTFLVGVSRVFLGVHYPSDVLGGWTAGLTWAVLCWTVARSLQRRGAIETPVRH